jgi:DNA uptake protein ComE-like DNA-binding protein
LASAQQNQQSPPPLQDQSAYPAATHKMTPAEKSSTPAAHGQPVDLNSGSKKDLAALPGVGPDLAQNIILARPFKTKDDLLRKKIVPQSTFEQIKDLVTVQGPKKQSIPTKSNPE